MCKQLLFYPYIALSCRFFQGFFKDMLTVNNPNISPQRIEDYVNGAVSFKI